jgi:hypothetical protein
LDSQYVFFAKEATEENLLLTERASLEISLDNKSEKKYYVAEEEPLFRIYEREGSLQISFFIMLEGDAGLSNYRLNEDALRANQSFGHSE